MATRRNRLQPLFTEYEIAIHSFDADVVVTLPNDQCITLQWRSENETIDVLLLREMMAHVHPDDDLGKPIKAPGGAWLAKQIVLV